MSTPERLDFPDLTPAGTLPKITSIFDFSDKALNELRLWLEMHPPAIGIGQVLGFNQFTAQAAPYIPTAQSRTSSTPGDLGTVGPEITNLPDGQYLVVFGCALEVASEGAGKSAVMTFAINGTADSANDHILNANINFVSAAAIRAKTVENGGNNTITAKYFSQDNATAATFADRWLIALKYAN